MTIQLDRSHGRSRYKDLLALLSALAICEGAGLVGSLFTTPNIPGWYDRLVKPPLMPPSWVFGPVWGILYALMGVAAFIVWRRRAGRSETRAALVFFGAQLAVNIAWSAVFFALRSPGYGLLVIVVLWTAIAATIVLFERVSRTAAVLLVPYLLWVGFALYLNRSIWLLNPMTG